jgi:hypothetical protein
MIARYQTTVSTSPSQRSSNSLFFLDRRSKLDRHSSRRSRKRCLWRDVVTAVKIEVWPCDTHYFHKTSFFHRMVEFMSHLNDSPKSNFLFPPSSVPPGNRNLKEKNYDDGGSETSSPFVRFFKNELKLC